MAENPQHNDGKPPPFAPPPYPGPGDPSVHPQFPPPGQGYNWQQPPPPVTEMSAEEGYPQDKPEHPSTQPGYPGPYPSQPGYQAPAGNPGYPAQPGHQGYPAPPITTQHSVTVVRTPTWQMRKQEGPSVILAPQVAPPDYCGLSWFACLFCCWPIGICAILESNETRAAINRGDMVSATQLSLKTRELACTSISLGIIITLILTIRYVLLAEP